MVPHVPWPLYGGVAATCPTSACAAGAQLLGCGGGGSAYTCRLRLLREMAAGRQARVLPLAALPDTALVVDCGGMGAPTVAAEKLEAHEVGAWGGRLGAACLTD